MKLPSDSASLLLACRHKLVAFPWLLPSHVQVKTLWCEETGARSQADLGWATRIYLPESLPAVGHAHHPLAGPDREGSTSVNSSAAAQLPPACNNPTDQTALKPSPEAPNLLAGERIFPYLSL